jgi:MFS family permease
VGGLPEFSGSYVLVACAAALTVVLVSFLDVPKPTQEECVRCGRPLASIVRQPDYIVAVAAASLGYFAMALIMAATPLAMESSAFTFGTIAFVFQWHVVAMFAPSFGTGPLIARIGVVRVLALGVTLMVACVVINLLGRSEAFFWFALVLLGLGWNFLYVGGTALLTTTYRPEERAKSQGFNDLVVYAAITLAALATGEIDTLWGWRGINLSAAPAIAVVTGCVAWLAARTRRAEGAAPD